MTAAFSGWPECVSSMAECEQQFKALFGGEGKWGILRFLMKGQHSIYTEIPRRSHTGGLYLKLKVIPQIYFKTSFSLHIQNHYFEITANNQNRGSAGQPKLFTAFHRFSFSLDIANQLHLTDPCNIFSHHHSSPLHLTVRLKLNFHVVTSIVKLLNGKQK